MNQGKGGVTLGSMETVIGRPVLGQPETRPCDRIVRVDPLALSNCLVGVYQASAKLAAGDCLGAAQVMGHVRGMVPPGVVDGILGWAKDGTFPPLSAKMTSEWLGLAREARTGELAVSVVVCSDPAAHEAPVSPPPPLSRPDAPPPPRRSSLRDDLAAMGLLGDDPR